MSFILRGSARKRKLLRRKGRREERLRRMI